MKIAVVNKSTLVSAGDVRTMTTAVSRQVRQHVAKAWEMVPPSVVYCASETAAPVGAWKVLIFDDADVAGALGYHDDGPDGMPYGRVFAKVSLDNNVSISSVLSHEIVEIVGDPQANYWADAPDGKSYALELCDAVENDSYMVNVSGVDIEVSNFLLPGWFDPIPAAGAKFDWLGKLNEPFKMTNGGYVIVRTEGKISQQFGEEFPEWKKSTKSKRLKARPSTTSSSA